LWWFTNVVDSWSIQMAGTGLCLQSHRRRAAYWHHLRYAGSCYMRFQQWTALKCKNNE